MQSLLTDFRSQLIKLLNTPSGISEIGVTAARRLAKNLDQGTPTYGNTGTINPFSDEMGLLNANSEASRSNGHELFCSFAALCNLVYECRLIRVGWHRGQVFDLDKQRINFEPYKGSLRVECPLWVINGLFSTTSKMSAFGGKAEVIHCGLECPPIALNGL